MQYRDFRFYVTPRNGENLELLLFSFSFFNNHVIRKPEDVEPAPKAKGRGKRKEPKSETDSAAPAKRARGKKAQ